MKAKISVVVLLSNTKPIKNDICSLDVDERKDNVEWAVATVYTKELASARTDSFLGTPYELFISKVVLHLCTCEWFHFACTTISWNHGREVSSSTYFLEISQCQINMN